MKRLYKKIIKLLYCLIDKIDVLKILVFEWIAILRKAKLYNDIKWTDAQQRQFDDFWIKNYGKKISNRWHKLYESINGVFCVEYIPEIIYSTRIEPQINSKKYCEVYSDKSLNCALYNGVVDGVRTPKEYLSKDERSFFGENREKISESSAIAYLGDIGDAVIKPTVDSSSGHDIRVLCMHNGIDEKTGDRAEDILRYYKKNFIVQEKIVPHPDFAKLYEKSVNTIRLITYLCETGVSNTPVSMRIGSGGSEVDNIHSGGMVVGVSNEGVLGKKAYRLGYGDSKEYYTVHPDTNIEFDGYKLPLIEKMREAAYKLHTITPNVGMISWDFTINNEAEIIVIEANYTGQSAWFPQIVNEKPLFGEMTPEILNIVFSKKES